MELAFFFYLAGVIEGVGSFLCILSVITLFAFAVFIVVGALGTDIEGTGKDKWDKFWSKVNMLKKYPIIAVLALLLVSFLPSQKTMYTMAAAYGAQSVAENPDVKRLAGKSLDVLEQAMDKYLDKGDKKAP